MIIKVFLVFIIGITTTLNASLGNGIIDGIKIKKVENQTIFNQEAIKDAIYKYVRINKKYPNNLTELITQGVLTNDYNNNAFNGNYSIVIDKENKELKITTSIADNDIRDYFQRTLTTVQRIDKIGDSISSIYSIPTEISDMVNKPLFVEATISTTTISATFNKGFYTYYNPFNPKTSGGNFCIPYDVYVGGKCRRYINGYYSCPAGYTNESFSCFKRTYSCEVGYTLQPDKQCKLNN